MTGNLIATFGLGETSAGCSDALQGHLYALGCSGSWERDSAAVDELAGQGGTTPSAAGSDGGRRLDAYFTDRDWRPQLGAELAALAEDLGASFLGFELLLERDWMQTHRRLAQPRVVGDFLIDPREPDDAAASPPKGSKDVTGEPEAKWHLRVPARQAFGTGSHETTRLTLLALAELDVSGATVVDVGCGSGVLSFAAHRLGAKRVLGYDIDPVAAFASRVNAGLNQIGLGCCLRFAAGSQEMMVPGLAEVLLVNVLPEKIEGAERTLSALVRDGGSVVVSGLLGGEPIPGSTTAALERWGRLGWSPTRRLEEGEWLAFRLERNS